MILSRKSSFSNIFSSSFNISLIPPPEALITGGTTLTLNPYILGIYVKFSVTCFCFLYLFFSIDRLQIHLNNIKTLSPGANILGVSGKNIKTNS